MHSCISVQPFSRNVADKELASGIARFTRIDPKCNEVVPWSLHTFPENFMQIGPAVSPQYKTSQTTDRRHAVPKVRPIVRSAKNGKVMMTHVWVFAKPCWFIHIVSSYSVEVVSYMLLSVSALTLLIIIGTLTQSVKIPFLQSMKTDINSSGSGVGGSSSVLTCNWWNGCFCGVGSGKTAAFLVPILTQIYTNGPQANNTAAPKPAVSCAVFLCLCRSQVSVE